MIKGPKFSVIIPVYNVENYLSECLDSVINQSLFDIEIICVNDGSKDRSREILTEYQKRDSRILIIDKINGGLSSARNAGLKVATGDYIVFLDSDDYIALNTCERLYYEVLEHSPDIIVFGSHFFPGYTQNNPWLIQNLSVRNRNYTTGGLEPLLKENGAHPFVWRDCFRRDFLVKYNLFFEESARFAEDLIFQFSAFPLAKHVVFVSDKLYYYRSNRPNSLMDGAGKNLYQKYSYHIDALELIAEFWDKHDLLNKYNDEFMAWTIEFMGWDLYSYKGEGKKILIQRLCEFWIKNKMLNCKLKLSKKNGFYYKYIYKFYKKV